MDVQDIFLGGFVIVVLLVFVFLIVFAGCALYDSEIIKPKVADKVNNICKQQGYDYYESYEKTFLSTAPKAIICKYVDNYKKIEVIK